MGLSRRQFTQEFKLAAVRRLEQGVSIAEVARGLEVNPNVLHRWRREFRQGPGNAFPGNGKQRWSAGRVAELERKVGQQALEIDFLKGCLQHISSPAISQLTGPFPGGGSFAAPCSSSTDFLVNQNFTITVRPELGKPVPASALSPEPLDIWRREIRELEAVGDL